MGKLASKLVPVMATAVVIVLGTASVAQAGYSVPVPEVDPSTGIAALALVGGAVLLIRGRLKK